MKHEEFKLVSCVVDGLPWCWIVALAQPRQAQGFEALGLTSAFLPSSAPSSGGWWGWRLPSAAAFWAWGPTPEGLS